MAFTSIYQKSMYSIFGLCQIFFFSYNCLNVLKLHLLQPQKKIIGLSKKVNKSQNAVAWFLLQYAEIMTSWISNNNVTMSLIHVVYCNSFMTFSYWFEYSQLFHIEILWKPVNLWHNEKSYSKSKVIYIFFYYRQN